MMTIKSFELDKIRARYINSKKNKSGKAGSVERREPAIGGVVHASFGAKCINEFKIISELKEPRGIAQNDLYFAFSSENKVIIQKGEETFELENKWFSYIHALDFSPFDKHQLLISSSGFDCLFEYDLRTKQPTWDWFAWEHYSNEANDPSGNTKIYLSRTNDQFEKLISEGKKAKLINPNNEYLPTAMRAAFINSVSFSRQDRGKVIATLFHEGKSIVIDKESKESHDHITELSNPHGAWQLKKSDLVTSTSSGKLVHRWNNSETHFDFSGLPGKHIEMGEKEWIQNSIPFGQCIISIDSNRTSFIIIDPQNKSYNQISYPDHWAVQDFVIL
ncbi:MAG: hypothetical protein AAF487_13780 [Bacteroidota bacterium]